MPVMMEAPDACGRQWAASGWLGIVTAGALWCVHSVAWILVQMPTAA